MIAPALIDPFGRRIDYLRISVTDRCDFRCVYCMAEDMQFLPRRQLLTLAEILAVAQAFVSLGVRKIRITGGEPLIRRGVLELLQALSELEGLDELVLTTNGSQLASVAEALSAAGVQRLNISLDSLRRERFRQITRCGDLDAVLRGIDRARDAGFRRIKLNSVMLRGVNDDEAEDLLAFALQRQLDISFIEEMPLGRIESHQRADTMVRSDELRARFAALHQLVPSTESTGGPSRYYRIVGHDGSKVGFISPHSHNFCGDCNRVRLTAEGRLLLCLGNEHASDLRAVLRETAGDRAALVTSIREAVARKPERHWFSLDEEPRILRFMSASGG